MKITMNSYGSFKNTENLLSRIRSRKWEHIIRPYTERGLDALRAATPSRTGATAQAWYSEVHRTREGYEIVWANSNINKGANIAVLLQYGHGTGTGGYVRGIDYINPALKPVFQSIADDAWKEMMNS